MVTAACGLGGQARLVIDSTGPQAGLPTAMVVLPPLDATPVRARRPPSPRLLGGARPSTGSRASHPPPLPRQVCFAVVRLPRKPGLPLRVHVIVRDVLTARQGQVQRAMQVAATRAVGALTAAALSGDHVENEV